MSTRSATIGTALLAFACGAGAADHQVVGRGQPVTESDLRAWNISVFPSGAGLPAGSGTAQQGAGIFASKCAACHGDKGQGGLGPALITDIQRHGIDESTTSIANYWPYSTTLFDYVRRAMPWQSPRSLGDEEVYALVAFILAQNKLIPDDEVVDARSLPRVRMPNRDGFIIHDPKLTPPFAAP